jgi:hypothetical protein
MRRRAVADSLAGMAEMTNPLRASDELTQLSVDMRVWSLLLGEARRRAVTRVFGVPPSEQSLLVTIALAGAAGAVVRGAIPVRLPHPSRADAAMGGTVVNASLRGLAGAPSQAMPLAGALSAFGVLGHAFRPVVVGTVRDVQAMARRTQSALAARYTR